VPYTEAVTQPIRCSDDEHVVADLNAVGIGKPGSDGAWRDAL
jgi:hypothetical protein